MSEGSVLYVIQHYEQDPFRPRLPAGLTREERERLNRPGLSGHFKIGIARDVNRRLSSLRGGTPHKLRVVATVEIDGDAEAAEREFHELYDIAHFRGEWFTLLPDDVESFRELESVSPEEIAEVRREVADSGCWPIERKLLDLIEEVRVRL